MESKAAVTIGSVIIRNDPVIEPERFVLNLSPANGRSFARARFSALRPSDRAEGGYWGLSFRIHAREVILKELFENGLGRLVEVWGYGLEPDFEGWIDEIIYTLPPDVFPISLRGIANKVHMRADTDGDEVAERSTTIENSTSQNLYGIFDRVLGGGALSGSAVADQTVQQYVDLRSFPMPEADFGGSRGKEASIEIYARGYITTLERRIYNQTAETGVQSLSSEINTILTSIGQFIASSDRDANTTSIQREHDIDRRGLDVVLDIPRLGDSGNNRWLLRMEGRDCTGVVGRKALLRQAAPVEPPPSSA
jgi:hypothetical protein